MIASERALFIMRRINELGVVNLKDIAAQMGTSETTVRRDFEKLEKQGKLRRVQGGATTNGGTDSLLENVQISTRLKANVNVHEKQLVGNYAAGLVADGECVYLDDGTSLLPLAEQLLRRRVRIVTNNTMIPVSYTHLDVYKRQLKFSFQPFSPTLYSQARLLKSTRARRLHFCRA